MSRAYGGIGKQRQDQIPSRPVGPQGKTFHGSPLDRHRSSSTYHSSRKRSLLKVSNRNVVPYFVSLQHKFNVHVPLGYTFQPMSVGEDSSRLSCVSSYYFVTTPKLKSSLTFCVHTSTKSTTHRHRTYASFVCLMQICLRKRHWLVDPMIRMKPRDELSSRHDIG